MLAAETIYEALCAGDASAATLAKYPQKLNASWLWKEPYAVRNFHQALHYGMFKAIVLARLQMVTGGRGLSDPMHVKPGYMNYKWLNLPRTLVDQSTRFKPDCKLTFDRLTDVYHSSTRHVKISRATCTSSIRIFAAIAACASMGILAGIFVPRPFTKW
jgi:electron-transferring-flavoprotein dehydrogenase